MYFLRF